MRISILFFLICGLAIPGVGVADGSGGNTLASTMEVYVFPKAGQQSEQQSRDEAACYEWATSNTGADPFDLHKQSIAEAEATEKAKATAAQSGRGAGARGALRGAAAGAIVGEIVDDDASDGAEIGAAVGLISARRRARAASAQATEQAEQQGKATQKATEEKLGNFKKAFSVCLEAKDYLVKY
ncbi:MAG: glycine zipper family protein [Proteobacteria bacterium]|nr:glycine zipper family protein [Pseudomonadota bacterium]